MDCAVTLNSRESSAGVRPACTNSTICCLNCAGYGGLTLDIFGSLNTKNDVSTEPGQLQQARPIVRRQSTPDGLRIKPETVHRTGSTPVLALVDIWKGSSGCTKWVSVSYTMYRTMSPYLLDIPWTPDRKRPIVDINQT
jgi:hypothetical protein